jgi:exonuclease SbcC
LDIRLNYMAIKNFKGIKDFRIDANEQNISVLGDNATYKTSCYDAFVWIVSGKNSFNQADFGIKPLDEAGNEIHFLETEVEVGLSKDGKPLKLKKILTENWVKPKGKTEQEYKGNNIAYFFDEVPVGANEYKRKVDELIGEETFRLLTNPLYFNQHYKVGKLTDWQSRRMLLFEICGDITDEQIIAANPGLAKLLEVLDGKSIEDRKAIIAQSIKKLNEQIEKVGPAINENMRLIPETAIDYTATEAELQRLKTELSDIEQEISDAGNVVLAYKKKQQELFSLKGQLENIKSRIYKEANAYLQKLVDEKSQLQGRKYQQEANKNDYARQIPIAEKGIADKNSRLQQLREQWTRLHERLLDERSSTFVDPDESNFICLTCGQSLPQGDRETKLDEMRAAFEKAKKDSISYSENSLNGNKESGLQLKREIEQLQKNIEVYKTEVEKAEKALETINSRIAEIDTILQQPTSEPDYAIDAEYTQLSGKIGQLEAELNKPIEDTTAEARQRKAVIAADIENCNRALNNKRVVENAKARIEELKQSERDLSNQKSQLEGQLNLITEFIKAKANTLTDIMNSKFKYVRFRLFDIQQNGGVVEVCDTMVNTNGKWVPFGDGNTAGRINAGIDIINALSEHYGVRVPLFVDNRESITELAETESQVISLIKPDIRIAEDRQKYSKLVVEVD